MLPKVKLDLKGAKAFKGLKQGPINRQLAVLRKEPYKAVNELVRYGQMVARTYVPVRTSATFQSIDGSVKENSRGVVGTVSITKFSRPDDTLNTQQVAAMINDPSVTFTRGGKKRHIPKEANFQNGNRRFMKIAEKNMRKHAERMIISGRFKARVRG